MPYFYFGFENNKSNGGKFLYLAGEVLQSRVALQATLSVPYFLALWFEKRVNLQLRGFHVRIQGLIIS